MNRYNCINGYVCVCVCVRERERQWRRRHCIFQNQKDGSTRCLLSCLVLSCLVHSHLLRLEGRKEPAVRVAITSQFIGNHLGLDVILQKGLSVGRQNPVEFWVNATRRNRLQDSVRFGHYINIVCATEASNQTCNTLGRNRWNRSVVEIVSPATFTEVLLGCLASVSNVLSRRQTPEFRSIHCTQGKVDMEKKKRTKKRKHDEYRGKRQLTKKKERSGGDKDTNLYELVSFTPNVFQTVSQSLTLIVGCC